MSTGLRGAAGAGLMLIIVGVLVTLASGVMVGVMVFDELPSRREKMERFERALEHRGELAMVEGVATQDAAPLLTSTYTHTPVIAFLSKATVSRGNHAEQTNAVLQVTPFRLVTSTGAYPVTGPLREVVDPGVPPVPGQPNKYEILILPGDRICVLGGLSAKNGVEGFHGPFDIYRESAHAVVGREKGGVATIWSLIYGGAGGVLVGIAIAVLGRWMLRRTRGPG